VNGTDLEARSGSAYIWSGLNCSGTKIAGFTNVGCGGECHSITGPGDIRFANSANMYVSRTIAFVRACIEKPGFSDHSV
jgi:hypothetical protein